MFKVTFRFENGETVEGFAAAEENLLEVARKTNVAIDAPCSGNGSCGKCRVKLLKGTLNSPRTRHITEEEYAEGWRLSCASKVEDDIELMIPSWNISCCDMCWHIQRFMSCIQERPIAIR